MSYLFPGNPTHTLLLPTHLGPPPNSPNGLQTHTSSSTPASPSPVNNTRHTPAPVGSAFDEHENPLRELDDMRGRRNTHSQSVSNTSSIHRSFTPDRDDSDYRSARTSMGPTGNTDLIRILILQRTQFMSEMRTTTSQLSEHLQRLGDMSSRDPNKPSWFTHALKDSRTTPVISLGSPTLALLRSCYPHIRQWTAHDINMVKKELTRDNDSAGHLASKCGRYNTADDVNTTAPFCEHMDGTVMGRLEVDGMQQEFYALMNDLLHCGASIHDNWAENGVDFEDAVVYELERRFPALALCVGHVKAKLFIGLYYRVWVKKYHPDVSQVDGEAAPSASPSRKIKKRKRTNNPDLDEEAPPTNVRCTTQSKPKLDEGVLSCAPSIAEQKIE